MLSSRWISAERRVDVGAQLHSTQARAALLIGALFSIYCAPDGQ